MFTLNGSTLQLDTPFTDANGTQYPANWLRLATPEERTAIGIAEVADPDPYDDRYYWSLGNPKDLDQCKAMLVAQVKQTAASLLAPTDWKVVRFTETGTAVDTATSEYRTAVRTASNTTETAINACTTVDELAALQLTWPENE
jgi:hypothetical protein